MKASVSINQRGTQLRLEGENEFERALIEFMDFNYTASVYIERDHDDVYNYARQGNGKVKAAVFTLLRDAEDKTNATT